MARVAVLVTVTPSSVDVNLGDLLNRIKGSLPQGYEVLNSGEEPIAFGLRALKLVIAMPEDVEGGTETLEDVLRSVPDVEDVQVEAVTRMSE
ncbi:elongation factor 1-beta [Acidilobus sp.]|uniref:elongation factor 1-beta n=1 Tax=Acidilobus sp. TaxID=1872109 RepID=UPI003D0447A3